MEPVLDIRDLRTHFFTDAGVAKAVDGVSLHVNPGETVALVGESGCGKSVTALSVMRLIPDPPGRIVSGDIRLGGEGILTKSVREMRSIRGNTVSMVFQEPMTSLNPVFRIGSQLEAVIRLHRLEERGKARKRAAELLGMVGIPSPEERLEDFPHQMSGGMRQRVMIAMALACDPALLIADEPTTALDVTIQAQILDLLRSLQDSIGMAILLITHDLGVVAEMADRVAIMYAGKIVEQASVEALFSEPKHPYAVGLFRSLPTVQSKAGKLETIPGQVPAATMFPEGCRFHPRCPHAMDVCRRDEPVLEGKDGHVAACWLHDAEVMAWQGRETGLPGDEAVRDA